MDGDVSGAADGRRLDWDGHVDAIVATYEVLGAGACPRVAGRPG